MWIMALDNSLLSAVKFFIEKQIKTSRFTACLDVQLLNKVLGIKITRVRLRKKKDYCGAHPGPCLVDGRKHAVRSFLEGLDWVGFNALLNDVLDTCKVSAHVFSFNREAAGSGKYYIRRDTKRRIAYPFVCSGRFAHWTQSREDFATCFEDYCGKEPPSIESTLIGLDGTPGYACYTIADEEKCRRAELEYA